MMKRSKKPYCQSHSMTLTLDSSHIDGEKPVLLSPFVLIFLGPPGSGKGTHARPLSKILKVPHISSGDLLRSHIERKTPLGKKLESFMDKGKFPPDELILETIFERTSLADCSKGYILDGFPRTLAQAKILDERLPKLARRIVLTFTLDDVQIVKRLIGRISCKLCAKSYHKIFCPPKEKGICDDCASALITRKDDTEKTVWKRLSIYRQETLPLVTYYREKADALYPIDSSLEKSSVFSQIIEVLKTASDL